MHFLVGILIENVTTGVRNYRELASPDIVVSIGSGDYNYQ